MIRRWLLVGAGLKLALACFDGRASPAHIATLVRATFALRKGRERQRVTTGPRITFAASLAMKVAILATSSGSVSAATSAS